MANPILQGAGASGAQNSSLMSRIAGIINDIGTISNVMSNPVQAAKDMIESNPKYQSFKELPEMAQKYVDENGGDAEGAFRKFARDNGVNPDMFMGLLGRFIK